MMSTAQMMGASHNFEPQTLPWEVSAYNRPAGAASVQDYTRASRYNPTASGVQGGIFGGMEVEEVNHRAQAVVHAHPSGGGYGKGDFLDRLAAAEARDGMVNTYSKQEFAGMRPSIKPSKDEQRQALTKRQTTLRAAEERVREAQQEKMQQFVTQGMRRQFSNTPQIAAVEQYESQADKMEQQRRRQWQQQDRHARIESQISDYQMEQQEKQAAAHQKRAMLQVRREAEMRQHKKEQERQQYVAQREQAWRPNYLQSRGGTPMQATQQVAFDIEPHQRQQQQQRQRAVGSPAIQRVAGTPSGRGASPRRPSPRGGTPARGASPRRDGFRSSTSVLAPPGGASSITFG